MNCANQNDSPPPEATSTTKTPTAANAGARESTQGLNSQTALPTHLQRHDAISSHSPSLASAVVHTSSDSFQNRFAHRTSMNTDSMSLSAHGTYTQHEPVLINNTICKIDAPVKRQHAVTAPPPPAKKSHNDSLVDLSSSNADSLGWSAVQPVWHETAMGIQHDQPLNNTFCSSDGVQVDRGAPNDSVIPAADFSTLQNRGLGQSESLPTMVNDSQRQQAPSGSTRFGSGTATQTGSDSNIVCSPPQVVNMRIADVAKRQPHESPPDMLRDIPEFNMHRRMNRFRVWTHYNQHPETSTDGRHVENTSRHACTCTQGAPPGRTHVRRESEEHLASNWLNYNGPRPVRQNKSSEIGLSALDSPWHIPTCIPANNNATNTTHELDPRAQRPSNVDDLGHLAYARQTSPIVDVPPALNTHSRTVSALENFLAKKAAHIRMLERLRHKLRDNGGGGASHHVIRQQARTLVPHANDLLAHDADHVRVQRLMDTTPSFEFAARGSDKCPTRYDC